mmetsp:Transcript_6414/g.12237  ORF Transcript_6414/g.12237 Transcript_6414/m.12237 type:complete len:727 (-) Transcript_6414:277-2457(-)
MLSLLILTLNLLLLPASSFHLAPPSSSFSSRRRVQAIVPLRSHTITTETDALGNEVHTLNIPSISTSIQTGAIGRQASSALLLTTNTTTLYATACLSRACTDRDFLPLSVEYQERFSSAGLTSGGYGKREGRPTERETLMCRLMDRPVRPLVDQRVRNECQLLSWVLSYDGETNLQSGAVTLAAAAAYMSDIPMSEPCACASVGMDEGGGFVLNPTRGQAEGSALDLTIAGTETKVLMVEGHADFITEEKMCEAISFGMESVREVCKAVRDFKEKVGRVEKEWSFTEVPESVASLASSSASPHIDLAYSSPDKSTQVEHIEVAYETAKAAVESSFPGMGGHAYSVVKSDFERRMYELALQGKRVDGRSPSDVRPIDIKAPFLPNAHGSAVFTRGETQAVATATLGDKGMELKYDTLWGQGKKRFYLQYSFPPSSVGETGRVGGVGRREVGHGNLAERALSRAIPSDFPYTVRVESLITESHGSSSMASVCGGYLAMREAGVPLKEVVAGVAMGAVKDREAPVEESVVLSDLMGVEDALGVMDFKVAGSRTGITTFQLDTKTDGLTVAFMEKALRQAKEARIHIIEKMEEAGAATAKELPDKVPKVRGFTIDEGGIGKVIGPGGKQIRSIIEDFELSNMDVGEGGEIQVSGFNSTRLAEVQAFVEKLVAPREGGGGRERSSKPRYEGPEPEEGKTYTGKVTGVHKWGVFLEILPGLEGLCHVSELHV